MSDVVFVLVIQSEGKEIEVLVCDEMSTAETEMEAYAKEGCRVWLEEKLVLSRR